MASWNPWHGCHKLSEGCLNCYVYRIDKKHGKDSSVVTRTRDFDLPVRRKRDKTYKIEPGDLVYTCFSSDFFVEEADPWRPEAWRMMRERGDLHFFMTTKRIDRFLNCIPEDWGDGYENVTICCTIENQDRADYRLPIYRDVPIRHKMIICEPLLGHIDFCDRLGTWVEQVIVGGESGDCARVCDYGWVLSIREQCMLRKVPFSFKQTGARLLKDGHLYRIKRCDQHAQAQKAKIDIP